MANFLITKPGEDVPRHLMCEHLLREVSEGMRHLSHSPEIIVFSNSIITDLGLEIGWLKDFDIAGVDGLEWNDFIFLDGSWLNIYFPEE